ncbi:hypothetical protein OAC89_04915 [Deltaproteobacteria bacterium]|nr:hypothetical protein [Deltaproteobacteria bacterium]
MSQKILQMQMAFVPVQDRLMFRLRTTNRAEFKLWFTRRYVKLLWQSVQRMLTNTQSGIIADSQTKQAMISLQHEEALANVDFKTQYREEKEIDRPLGNEPVLVSKIQVKPGPGDDTQVLCLQPEKGNGLEIVFDSTLLHTFCKLIEESVQKTDWDLDCRIVDHTMPVSQTAH